MYQNNIKTQIKMLKHKFSIMLVDQYLFDESLIK